LKLLTKEVTAALPGLYATEEIESKDKLAVCKFFDPCGNWTWYAVEGEPINADGDTYSQHLASGDPGPFTPADFMFFGMVDGHERELGYWCLGELSSVKNRFGLGIERDLYFRPKPLGEILPDYFSVGDGYTEA